MIEVYDATFACITEIERGTLVRQLAAFHVVVDAQTVEDDTIRLWLGDGRTITLGLTGIIEVAR
jgi:hypothetical protein